MKTLAFVPADKSRLRLVEAATKVHTRPAIYPKEKTMTAKQEHDLQRLQGLEATWQAIYFVLAEHNPETFHGHGTLREQAVREIKRLQAIALAPQQGDQR